MSFLFDKDGNITDEAYNEINEKGVEGLVDYVNRETGSSYTLSTKEADSRRGIANQKEINRIYSPVNSVSRDEVLNALNDISVEDILTVITNERNTRELFENIGNVAVASVSFNVATVTESNAGGGGTGGGGTSGGDDTGETTSGTTEPPPGYTPNGGTTGGTTYGY